MDFVSILSLLAQTDRRIEIREPPITPETIWLIGAVLFAVWLFAMGACVGSFLNVVVYRVPAGINLSSPGSRCLHPIRWSRFPFRGLHSQAGVVRTFGGEKECAAVTFDPAMSGSPAKVGG